MKKMTKLLFFVPIVCIFVFFSGCGVYEKIDLKKAHQEIMNLRKQSVDILKIKETIEEDSYFGILEDVELDTLSSLKINKEYIAKTNQQMEYIFRIEKRNGVNTIPLTSYIIVKYAEDKKELLENQIDTYYQSLLKEYSEKDNMNDEIKNHLKNVMKKEYEGYLVYILSYNNDEVWEKIKKSSHPLLYENIKELSLDEFASQVSIEKKDITEYQGFVTSKDSSANLYFIVKPKNGKAETVKKQLDQYMENLEKKWSTYLPEQYQLVKNRMKTEIGSYFIYIISSDNEKVLNTIKNSVVKKD